MRIVSLAPSITESVFFLGLGEELVGVTEQCNRPEAVFHKERIGSFIQPDVDKIASLNPDLVIAAGNIHEPLAHELAGLDLQVFIFGSGSVEEILVGIEEVGGLCGRTGIARSLVGALRDRLAEIEKRIAGAAVRPRVFRLMGSQGMMGTPGPGSYQYDAIRIGGGEPMPVVAENGYTPVSLEAIAEFDPQVIIGCGRKRGEEPSPRCKGCTRTAPACQREIEDIYSWNGWEDVSAVRDGRVYCLSCETICRPGSNVVYLVEQVAGIFHPDSCH